MKGFVNLSYLVCWVWSRSTGVSTDASSHHLASPLFPAICAVTVTLAIRSWSSFCGIIIVVPTSLGKSSASSSLDSSPPSSSSRKILASIIVILLPAARPQPVVDPDLEREMKIHFKLSSNWPEEILLGLPFHSSLNQLNSYTSQYNFRLKEHKKGLKRICCANVNTYYEKKQKFISNWQLEIILVFPFYQFLIELNLCKS